MENNKALTADQLNALKATVRKRFDDLYHRIGTNRQKLATTVLLVDQSINKELAKEKIDASHEKDILGKLREMEKMANNQLPHMPKPVSTAPTLQPKVAAQPKAPAAPKPEKKAAAKAKPKAKKK
jgi:hypothetical protein